MSDDIMQAAVGVKTLLRFTPEDEWASVIAKAMMDETARLRTERDHFYNQFQAARAALTPRSEEEKRGFERVLAILKAKLSDGGGIVGPSEEQRAHNNFYRGRRMAFEECTIMLTAALKATGTAPSSRNALSGGEGE
ncbi:hypothetical protein [Shinella zoogloeoides]|uniref:hypothetical protein n=1 Tax=Shinella zoogloeoides TaxID=352475 RepID=UPI00299E4319|nr:hypothetical protein [Shinella zoogloeoides]WPE22435.1 hypothetical protein ShzoTeo12_36510 [Shinella zoogloeoides]